MAYNYMERGESSSSNDFPRIKRETSKRQSAIRARADIASQFEAVEIIDETDDAEEAEALGLIKAKDTPGSLAFEVARGLNAHAFVFRPGEWQFIVNEYTNNSPWWLIPPSAEGRPDVHELASRILRTKLPADARIVRPLYVMLSMLYPGHPYVLQLKANLEARWAAEGFSESFDIEIKLDSSKASRDTASNRSAHEKPLAPYFVLKNEPALPSATMVQQGYVSDDSPRLAKFLGAPLEKLNAFASCQDISPRPAVSYKSLKMGSSLAADITKPRQTKHAEQDETFTALWSEYAYTVKEASRAMKDAWSRIDYSAVRLDEKQREVVGESAELEKAQAEIRQHFADLRAERAALAHREEALVAAERELDEKLAEVQIRRSHRDTEQQQQQMRVQLAAQEAESYYRDIIEGIEQISMHMSEGNK